VASVDAAVFGPGVLDGAVFQEKIERAAFELNGSFRAPIQTVGRFISGKSGAEIGRITPSYPIGTDPADISEIFPPALIERLREGITDFGRKIPGFDVGDAVLTAPETRTSSPVRILRDQRCVSVSAEGLYPCGEGAGYAGGITSAAVDGLRCAMALMRKYRPFA